MANKPDRRDHDHIDNRELSSQIELRIEEESRNLFKNDVTRRKIMSGGARIIAILVVILIVLYLATIFLVPIGFGSLDIYRQEVVTNFQNVFSLDVRARERLACFAAVVLVGMAMATAGATFQGIFQNPMASPTTLGVQAGGMLGGLVYVLFFMDTITLSFYEEHTHDGVFAAASSEMIEYTDSLSQFQKFGLELWEVAGCFFGVALIVFISLLSGRGKINTVALMLGASVFSTVMNEIGQTVQYVILYNQPEGMSDARYGLISEMMGSSYAVMGSNMLAIDQFLWMAVPIGLCLAVMFAMSGRLNVLMFGEEEARAMGLPVQTYRIILISVCTLACAVVFSFNGAINMVGFIIPLLTRFMVGPNFKYLVPASALMGGITCLLIYDCCSVFNILDQFNVVIGGVCSVLSVIFLVFFRRQRQGDWA